MNVLKMNKFVKNSYLYSTTFNRFMFSTSNNPKVFMDVSRDGKSIGKLTFEVNLFLKYLFSFMQIKFLRQLKISDHYVLVTIRTNTHTKKVISIE